MAKEKNLTAVTSVAAADFARVVTSAGASVKATFANVAKYIIETYNGSTVAGSAQSVKSALDSLNSNCLKLYRQRTSDNEGNLANMFQTAGLYLWVMKYSADTSAYYIGFAYKADGANAVQTVIANNKLSVGAQNNVGTAVVRYNNVATAGVVGTAYTLG